MMRLGIAGGALEDLSETVVAVVIKEGAHHTDLMFTNKDDPASVTEARDLEMSHVKRWLQAHREQSATVLLLRIQAQHLQ